MSAWYVLAAAGLHPACPGDTRMEITSPVFDRIELRLDPAYAPGGTFTVVAHGNSPSNVYIQRAVLNGREHTASHLDFADIAAGGTLELYTVSYTHLARAYLFTTEPRQALAAGTYRFRPFPVRGRMQSAGAATVRKDGRTPRVSINSGDEFEAGFCAPDRHKKGVRCQLSIEGLGETIARKLSCALSSCSQKASRT